VVCVAASACRKPGATAQQKTVFTEADGLSRWPATAVAIRADNAWRSRRFRWGPITEDQLPGRSPEPCLLSVQPSGLLPFTCSRQPREENFPTPKVTSALVLAFLGFLSGSNAAHRTGEVPLGRHEMSLLFGGDSVNAKCCLQIQACSIMAVTCASYVTMTTCTSGQQADLSAMYSKACSRPTPPCPTCNCANFQNDSHGGTYNCVTYYDCTWSAGVCSKGAQSGGVQGYYSCADNCL
jgi:hypothetical protein